MNIRELWHISSTQSAIQSRSVRLHEEECMVQTLYSYISQGSERTVAMGKAEGLENRMSVPGMQGNFTLPCTYGYSLVGEIIDGPPSYIGKRVHALHTHQDLIKGDFSNFSVVPDSIPSKRATLKSNMETVVNAIWDSNLKRGETVLILGAGNVGLLLALTLERLPGIDAYIWDENPSRAEFATSLGMKVGLSSHKAHVVFHTTGSETGLQTAIEQLMPEGRVIELSWYGNRKVQISLGGTFHYDRKRIISSQVSVIPPHKKGWDFNRRTNLVWKLLMNEKFDKLTEHCWEFNDSPALFEKIRTGEELPPSILLKY